MLKIEEVEELESGLSGFYGTEGFHKLCILSDLLATDGVAYLCEKASCYWLFDAIASYQKACRKDAMLKDMQFWTLKVNLKKQSAVLICERDKGDVAFRQKIEYTDFPLSEIKFYVQNKVVMLPSEY